MTLIARAVRGWHKLNIMVHQRRLITEQRKTIAAMRALMEAKEDAAEKRLHHFRLEHLREVEGIMSGWLISLERPEDDEGLRLELAEMTTKLGHQIAALEEHVVT